MALPKPSTHTSWTDGDSAKQVEPSAAKKLLGWVALERPPFEYFNWLFYTADLWAKYLESITDEQGQKIAAVVDAGGNGTHTTLQAAHDDAAVVAGSKILIISHLEIDATVNLTKNDIEYEMRPGFRMRKGSGAAASNFTGVSIQATADRCRFFGMGFGGAGFEFNGTGDKCLLLDSGADDVLFFNNFFEASNTENFDDGSNTSYVNLAEITK